MRAQNRNDAPEEASGDARDAEAVSRSTASAGSKASVGNLKGCRTILTDSGSGQPPCTGPSREGRGWPSRWGRRRSSEALSAPETRRLSQTSPTRLRSPSWSMYRSDWGEPSTSASRCFSPQTCNRPALQMAWKTISTSTVRVIKTDYANLGRYGSHLWEWGLGNAESGLSWRRSCLERPLARLADTAYNLP